MPAELRRRMRDCIQEADEWAAGRAEKVLGVADEEGGGHSGARRGVSGRARGQQDTGQQSSGGGGAEGDGGGQAGGSKRLQNRLITALEREQVDQVLHGLAVRADPPGFLRHARLADLSNAQTKHGWLSAVNSAHGPVLQPQQFITCLRLRLGLPVAAYSGPERCTACLGQFTDDAIGPHALCCARGQATVGHNRVRDHVADLAKISDSNTSIEESSAAAIGSDARVRPADILTSATPLGRAGSAALDIGICCPHTRVSVRRGGAVDVLDEYHLAKVSKYHAVAAGAGWGYYPMTMTCYGRPHHTTIAIVHKLAMAAARRFGVEDSAKIEENWWRNCSTLLAERAARMVMKCSPTIRLPRVLGGGPDADEEAGGGSVGHEVDLSEVVVRDEGGEW